MKPAFTDARLTRIARRPDLQNRAGAVLFSRFRRGVSRAIPTSGPLFASHLVDRCADRALLRRYVLQTRAEDGPLRSNSSPSSAIAFLRAVTAMARAEYADAIGHFGRFLAGAEFGGSKAEACAVLLIDRMVPLLADHAFPENDERSAALRGHLLVLVEPSSRAIDVTASLPGDTLLSILSASGRTGPAPDARIVDVEGLSAAYWYTEAASRFHSELFIGARAALSRVIGGAEASSLDAAALHAVDILRAEYWTLHRARERLERETFDGVVVLGTNPRFRTLARLFLAGHRLQFVGFRRAAPPPRPDLPFWPSHWQMRQTRAAIRRSRAAAHARQRLMTSPGGGQPALILWAIGNPDYERALHAVLDATLSRRPAILLLRARNDASERFVQGFEKRHGQARHAASVSYFEDVAPDRVIQTAAKAEAIRRLLSSDGSTISDAERVLPLAIASHRGVIGPLIAFGFGVDLAVELAAAHRLPYCIAAPGRSGMYSAIIAALRARGIPSVDTFLYTVANSVRQLSSGATHFAVVDTQQVEFCARYWGAPSERFVPVGYLAASCRLSASAGEAAIADSAVSHVVVATQPGSNEQVSALIDIATALDARLPAGVAITIKPHPREQQESASRYRALVEGSLTGRLAIDAESAPSDVIDRADLLVTRTSNMGLEAAISGRAVVRCPYLEADIDPRFNETPYALNAGSDDQAVALVMQLIMEPALRRALAESRRAYFEANPALVHCDGARRLIDFAEDVVTAWRPPSSPSAKPWWRRLWSAPQR